MLMKLLVGELPWEAAASPELCHSQKREHVQHVQGGVDSIADGLLDGVAGAHEVSSFYARTMAIGFKEEPDYAALDAMLKVRHARTYQPCSLTLTHPH